ncbi:MAG: GDP-mannose 4,6-dehydratase [Sphaerochaetaceae bacterium]|nr:GDP-mannose 4,6-dehydratase [Sphaerochaetaceae bacterium]
MDKVAVITGITGQDGSYLTNILLEKGYKVYGLVRRSSSFNTARIESEHKDVFHEDKLTLVYGDLTDSAFLSDFVKKTQPDEFYNLGAQSHVRISFDNPVYTCEVDAIGVLNSLEAIRNFSPQTKFYQASSSEMFGKVQEVPQKETTPFYPRSPYGCAKVFGYNITKNYRESYNLFGCNGILFNHESPRRGKNFVTRKITWGLASIKYGLQDKLYLGNLDAKRDWGYAKDYVEAMWLMLQQKEADDFVVATGETHSVREFLEEAFIQAGFDPSEMDKYIEIDSKYYRPAEVDLLLGDPTKAKEKLGWEPKVTFKEHVKMMVNEDMKKVEQLSKLDISENELYV